MGEHGLRFSDAMRYDIFLHIRRCDAILFMLVVEAVQTYVQIPVAPGSGGGAPFGGAFYQILQARSEIFADRTSYRAVLQPKVSLQIRLIAFSRTEKAAIFTDLACSFQD